MNLVNDVCMTAAMLLSLPGAAFCQDSSLEASAASSAAIIEAIPTGTASTPAGYAGNFSVYAPLTAKERRNLYFRRAFVGPETHFRAATVALAGQLSDEPPEWRQGLHGYSLRFADRLGLNVIRATSEAAVAAALRHEVRYIPNRTSNVFGRVGHALSATFVTYGRHGRRTPNVARIGSAFASEFARGLWMPERYKTNSRAMRGVGIQLGVNGIFNLAREFAPEIRGVLPWK
jgi:hypothetical protein